MKNYNEIQDAAREVFTLLSDLNFPVDEVTLRLSDYASDDAEMFLFDLDPAEWDSVQNHLEDMYGSATSEESPQIRALRFSAHGARIRVVLVD